MRFVFVNVSYGCAQRQLHMQSTVGHGQGEGEGWGARVWTPAQDVLNAWEPVTASCNMQQMRHADKAYNASTSHNDVV